MIDGARARLPSVFVCMERMYVLLYISMYVGVRRSAVWTRIAICAKQFSGFFFFLDFAF